MRNRTYSLQPTANSLLCRRPYSLQPTANSLPLPADDGLTPTLNAVAMPADAAPEWLTVPFGEVPYDVNGVKGLQRLNPAVCERLVNAMSRAMTLDPRNSGGFPFYVGHPDFINSADPAALTAWLQNQPPAVGWIKAFRAAADALELRVEWTAEGRALVNAKTYRFFSPFFRSEPVAQEGGVQIYEPRLIQSAGLTNTPNWPMPPMVNAALPDGGTMEGGMNLLQRLIALLGDESVQDDDAMVMAVSKLIEAAKALKASVESKWQAEDAARLALPNAGDPFALAAGFIAHLEGSVSVATANAAALAEKAGLVATLGAQLTAARTAHAETLVNAAVSRGSVLQEHAASRVADLVNAGEGFAAKAAELASLPPLMKTASATADAGPRTVQVADRRARFQELVNAAMPDCGNDYDKAFASVASKHPELLGGSPANT